MQKTVQPPEPAEYPPKNMQPGAETPFGILEQAHEVITGVWMGQASTPGTDKEPRSFMWCAPDRVAVLPQWVKNARRHPATLVRTGYDTYAWYDGDCVDYAYPALAFQEDFRKVEGAPPDYVQYAERDLLRISSQDYLDYADAIGKPKAQPLEGPYIVAHLKDIESAWAVADEQGRAIATFTTMDAVIHHGALFSLSPLLRDCLQEIVAEHDQANAVRDEKHRVGDTPGLASARLLVRLCEQRSDV